LLDPDTPIPIFAVGPIVSAVAIDPDVAVIEPLNVPDPSIVSVEPSNEIFPLANFKVPSLVQ